MAVPAGFAVRITSVQGAPGDRVTIAWQLVNATSGAVGPGGSLRVPAIAPQSTQQFAGDGATTAFTTTAAAYGAANAWAAVGGVASSPAPAFTVSGSTLTATFATAPAADKSVLLGFDAGPGLNNAAGDMAGILGLSAAQGTLYGGTIGGFAVSTAHRNVADLAGALFAWAQATVEALPFFA